LVRHAVIVTGLRSDRDNIQLTAIETFPNVRSILLQTSGPRHVNDAAQYYESLKGHKALERLDLGLEIQHFRLLGGFLESPPPRLRQLRVTASMFAHMTKNSKNIVETNRVESLFLNGDITQMVNDSIL
jgi:hypothetical protein